MFFSRSIELEHFVHPLFQSESDCGGVSHLMVGWYIDLEHVKDIVLIILAVYDHKGPAAR